MIDHEVLEALIRSIAREEMRRWNVPEVVESLEFADQSKRWRDQDGVIWVNAGYYGYWCFIHPEGDASGSYEWWEVNPNGPFVEVR